MKIMIAQINNLGNYMTSYCERNGLDSKRILGEVNSELKQMQCVKSARVTGVRLSGKVAKNGKDSRKTTLTIGGQKFELQAQTPPLVTYQFFYNLELFCETQDTVIDPSPDNLPFAARMWMSKFKVAQPAAAVPTEQSNPTKQPAQ